MKVSFEIGNDPLTYVIELPLKHEEIPKNRTSEPRTAKKIFMQEVQK